MPYTLHEAFTHLMYLTETLDLNYLEGMILESVIKPTHTTSGFRQALRDLDVLIASTITLMEGRSTLGLDNYFNGAPERGYTIGRIVTLIARARYRTTCPHAIHNYKAAAAMIHQMLQNLEALELALDSYTEIAETDEDTIYED